MKIVSQNKKASFDYFLLEKYEAGIKLTGTEIKSIRAGKSNINDAYVQVKHNKVFIINMFISKYDHGNIFNHDERRTRELLLNKNEILKLIAKTQQDGHTLVATKTYFKGSLLKVEFALAKGKKNYDKREDIKEKDSKRRMEKAIKNSMY
ncbi:MAG: SsrA-binding protein SmpB [bacterium]